MAIIAAVCSLTVSLITFFLTRWQVRKELEEKFNDELRSLRTPVYEALWQSTGLFPKYARPPENPTYDQVQRLTEQLRDWYFEKGGLYFSEPSRDAYFALQESLEGALKEYEKKHAADKTDPTADPVDVATYEIIRKTASTLRTNLSADLGTRTKREEPTGARQPENQKP